MRGTNINIQPATINQTGICTNMLFEKVVSLVRLVDEFDGTTTVNAGFVGDVGRALIFGMVTEACVLANRGAILSMFVTSLLSHSLTDNAPAIIIAILRGQAMANAMAILKRLVHLSIAPFMIFQ